MRVLVTLLTSFVLALGLLGAGLTLLHTLPRKHRPTDPGVQLTPPTDFTVIPRPIEPRPKSAVPSEASFEKKREGDLRLSGQILLPGKAEIGLQLLRTTDEVGLFHRRTRLGTQRNYAFEGLKPGQYRLQIHDADSGQVLHSQEIQLDSDRVIQLKPRVALLTQDLEFTPAGGQLQPGAILVLEDGRFFHQRLRGQDGGQFVAKGLPVGNLSYTIRGRLSPTADHLTWKGSLRILPHAGAVPPLEIQMGEAEKDSLGK